MFASSFLVSF